MSRLTARLLRAISDQLTEKIVPDLSSAHAIEGASLVAVSGRNFEEGWTGEFVKGATSFAGLRQIELTLIALLRRFDPAQQV